MGACLGKQKHTRKEYQIIELPSFIYVDRTEKEILKVSSSKTSIIPFSSPLHIYKNSLIGYSPLGLLYIIGGIKPNNNLTKTVSELNFKDQTSKTLPKFPQKIPQGQINFINNEILVINSLSVSLHSFTLNSDKWIFIDMIFPQEGNNKIQDFSSCVYLNYLYIFGGRFSIGCYNLDIYAANMVKREYMMKKINLKIPVRLINPKCIVCKEYKILGGGICEDGSFNCRFYVNCDEIGTWNIVECPSYDSRDNYPVVYVGEVALLPCYPIVVVFANETFVVFGIKQKDDDGFKNINREKPKTPDSLQGAYFNEVTQSQKSPEKLNGFHEENIIESPIKIKEIEFGASPKQMMESFSSSDSSSLILRARVLTPVNGTFRETISSIESGDSSQILSSDEESSSIILSNPENDSNNIKFTDKLNENNKQIDLRISSLTEEKRVSDINRKSEITEEFTSRKISVQHIRKMHNFDVIISYTQAKEFLNFMIEVLQVKNSEKLPEKIKNFTLYEFEKMMQQFRYKLYPIETFKIIIKALDLIFRAKKWSKKEISAFEEVAGLYEKIEFIKKEKFISAVLLRVKFIVLREKQI
ncbi:hypothetical protein SteCoe_9560 [Stentor coeruleus]|uniref:Uncharacterized protein n=1 Tax=Stentor coeruleus TaxID=5963 RepID=A0A1R2CHK6_9CILI|nr:hypothetical protein SteCoe_9560 [Stentor coeruleus]